MYVYRRLYSRIVDILFSIFFSIIIIMIFYSVLNLMFCVEKKIEYLVFIIAIVLGVCFSCYVINLYYKIQPKKIQMYNGIIVYNLVNKKHIKIQDIIKIERMNSWVFMSSSAFIIKTKKNNIKLNSNRYRNLDKFILELKKQIDLEKNDAKKLYNEHN